MNFWWLYPLGGGSSGTGSASTTTVGPPTVPSEGTCVWLPAPAPVSGFQKVYPQANPADGVVVYQDVDILAFDSFKGPAAALLASRTWVSSSGVTWGPAVYYSGSTASYGYLGLRGDGAAKPILGSLSAPQPMEIYQAESFKTTDNFEVCLDGGWYTDTDGGQVGPNLLFWGTGSQSSLSLADAWHFDVISNQTMELSSPDYTHTQELSLSSTLGNLYRLGIRVSGGTITPWVEPFGGGSRTTLPSYHWSQFTGVSSPVSSTSRGFVGFNFTPSFDDGSAVAYFQFGVLHTCA